MANFNFNKVIIGGRLTSDPELRTTPNGISVTTFTVAVNRKGGNGIADFISITAWRQTAEFITKYFRKASSICIVGSLQTENWTDQQGNKRSALKIIADEANFVDTKAEMPGARPADDAPVPDYTGANAPQFEELKDDEELPF